MTMIDRNSPRLRATLLAAAGVLLTGMTAAYSVAQTPAPAPSRQEEGPVPEIEFEALSFDDARSRAERTGDLLLILWHDGDDNRTERLRDRIFGDEGVRRWTLENAEAVTIDVRTHAKDARRNGLRTEFPILDLINARTSTRIERLTPTSTATDFLAAVYGMVGDDSVLERPTGPEAKEPFRWLAWANGNSRLGNREGALQAVEGYTWCLRRADDHRPGFRARYLEYLLKRIAEKKGMAIEAVQVLATEREILAGRIRAGIGTRSDVYDLTRVDFWLRQQLETRDLFIELAGKGEGQEKARAWLFDDVVPVLGRFEQFDEINDFLGDSSLAYFERRLAAIKAEAERAKAEAAAGSQSSAPAEELATQDPMRYAIKDSRKNLVDDAAWVYEALLAGGQGATAKKLFQLVVGEYPTTRSFTLFMDRALRMEFWALAAEIADLGIATVGEKKAKGLMRRLRDIPVDGTDSKGK